MLFLYDPGKSRANADKHGIDFEEAQRLWDDENRIEFKLQHSGEQRYGTISEYGGSHWFAVFVYRHQRVRLISVRKATAKEASLYAKINNV